MGSFIFEEIEAFDRKQTAFSVHPRPISLLKLEADEIQYVEELKTAKDYVTVKNGTIATGKGAVIGLLDTGVNETQVLLADKVIHSMNYAGLTDTNSTMDFHGHGTHLAGIICASKGEATYFTKDKTETKQAAIRGVAPDAKIVSIKVTDEKEGYTTWWKIADGLEQIIKYNATMPESDKQKKVNIVLIAYNALDNIKRPQCTAHHRLQKLINFLWLQKIPVICSGGNGFKYFKGESDKFPETGLAYPAYLKHVIVAVSKDKLGNLSLFTQRIFNDSAIKVKEQFAVYGENTLSTGINSPNDYTVLSGSSQAAAMLAGICAIIYENKSDILQTTSEDFNSLLMDNVQLQTESITTRNRSRVNKQYFSTSI